MIREIKNDLIAFLSDNYLDENYQVQAGENYFNSSLQTDTQKIQLFSIGAFKGVPVNFLLVQGKSLNANRNTLSNLGTVDWGTMVILNVYIEISVSPQTAVILGDMYVDTLYNAFQVFVYNYKRYTPVEPSCSINKFFERANNTMTDFNAIKKLIISGDLIFTAKDSELTLKEYE